MCAKKFKVLLQHLEHTHGFTKEKAKEVSRKQRLVVKGARQKVKPTKCPYPGCGHPVVRVDLHLKTVHKVKGEELEQYKTMAKQERQEKKRAVERKQSEKVFLHFYVLKLNLRNYINRLCVLSSRLLNQCVTRFNLTYQTLKARTWSRQRRQATTRTCKKPHRSRERPKSSGARPLTIRWTMSPCSRYFTIIYPRWTEVRGRRRRRRRIWDGWGASCSR